MRKEFVPTDPVKAKAIAIYATSKLEQMREEADIERLKLVYRGWMTYADSEGVCEQIREHMLRAFNETAITIKAREKNAAKDAAKATAARMIGEAAE